MKIKEVFDRFCESMALIELDYRIVKDVSDKEYRAISEYASRLADNQEMKKYASSFHNMAFRQAKNGEHYFFGHFERGVEQRQTDLILHKNKQYQWLLVEAYEVYADYLDHTYAWCGHRDLNFWPLSDFGNHSLDEIQGKSFDWYLKAVQSMKNDRHTRLLNRLRKKLNRFEALERTNKLDVDFVFNICLIERLRHVVVHRGGVVRDQKDFLNGVLNAAGRSNNGKPDQNLVDYITWFFDVEPSCSNTINLLEAQHPSGLPGAYINRFAVLFEKLMAHAHMIFEVANADIQQPAI